MSVDVGVLFAQVQVDPERHESASSGIVIGSPSPTASAAPKNGATEKVRSRPGGPEVPQPEDEQHEADTVGEQAHEESGGEVRRRRKLPRT